MPQIRHLIYSVAVCTSFAAPSFAQGEPLVQECFEIPTSRDRLACYDTVLGRPFVLPEPDDPQPSRDIEAPSGLEFAAPYLEAPVIVGENLRLGLYVQDTLLEADHPDYILLDPLSDDEAFRAMANERNLTIAMESDPGIGEAAVLLISCREDITELKIVWDTTTSGSSRGVDFYYGTSLQNQTHERVEMRLIRDGSIFEAPRGLPSIRLISALNRGERFQVALDETGNEPRSAFFETSSLKQALPIQARFCFWTPTTVSESN